MLPDEWLDSLQQFRQRPRRRVPDRVPIDAVVVVDKNVPDAARLTEWNLRVCFAKSAVFFEECGGGFADDAETARHNVLNVDAGGSDKLLARHPVEARNDPPRGSVNVAKQLEGMRIDITHTVTASRSIASFISLSMRPLTETTSTGTPRRSQAAHVEQRRVLVWLDQEVYVALLPVLAARHGTAHPEIAEHRIALHKLPDIPPVRLQYL